MAPHKEGSKTDNLAKTTLYVRGIPSDIANDALLEYFSSVGPVKSAFAIDSKKSNDSNSSTKCGFVHYALADDAKMAIDTLKKKKLGGKVLKMEFAKHRNRGNPHSRSKDSAESVVDVDKEEIDIEMDGFESSVEKPTVMSKSIDVKKIRQLKALAKSIIISGISHQVDRKQLFKKLKKFGNVVDIEYPAKLQTSPSVDESFQGQAVVSFKSVLEAKKAAEKLDNHVFKGDKVKSCIYPNYAQCKKNNRVVIRNMKFSTTVTDAWNSLKSFGPILEISIPQKETVGDDGKVTTSCKGFGFVTFARNEDAKAAMDAINGKVVPEFGRMVVLDFVKPKDEYIQEKVENDKIKEEDAEKEVSDMEGTEIDEDEDEDDVSIEFSGDDSEGASDDERESEQEKALNFKDADEGKTLFIRNLSFQTTDEDLKMKFEEYGPVEYARIVVDHNTGLPKGTGFVKMSSAEDATKILDMQPSYTDYNMEISGHLPPESSSMINLGSRPLFVLKAMSKTTLKSNEEEVIKSTTTISPPNDKDKRNIYLLKEILYQSTSPVYASLSKKFLDGLHELHKARVKKLRKQMYLSVSRNRLSVRHLGKTVDESTLKKKAFDAVKAFQEQIKAETKANPQSVKHQNEFKVWKSEGLFEKIKITQVKLVLDKVTSKPMGFGFIEFTTHAHALACLRHVKNMELPANARRWVMEFAVENSVILRKREERMKKSAEQGKEKRIKDKKSGNSSSSSNVAKTVKKKIQTLKSKSSPDTKMAKKKNNIVKKKISKPTTKNQ